MDEWEQRRTRRIRENAAYIAMSPEEKIAHNIAGIKEELNKLNICCPILDEINFNTDDVHTFLDKLIIPTDCGQGRFHCIDCALSEINNARKLLK